MILVRLMGGLGNQMFQYAFGRYLAERNQTQVKIDTTLLNNRSQSHEIVTHRNLELDIFNIPLNYATQDEITRFNGKKYNNVLGKIYNKLLWQFRKGHLIIENKSRGDFDPELLNLKDNICILGSWQSEKYFKGIEYLLRKEYTFKNLLSEKAEPLNNEIKGCKSLCMHVRRGDYVTSPIYSKTLGALPLEYYLKSLEVMKSKHTIDKIFIFSDDTYWCSENFSNIENSLIVTDALIGKKISDHMQLMTHCKHFIISNSSFGWWSAWLSNSKEKTIIAPKQWHISSEYDSTDIVPESWIRI